tara:strand:+ start:6758 stop:8227 length:1470 start_codon:yes stop_codon:yes gene_type:complete
LKKYAVIDIGSNSVRLVVYESPYRAPYVLFNEKVLCGLGRGVSETGLMQQETMDAALSTLKRFAMLIDKMSVSGVRVIATSAVREARNGPDFVRAVKQVCGLEVQVIDGEEEARLAGLGVLCAMPHADGVAGDLGGGSLELVHVANGNVHEKISLPIGPLQFQAPDGESVNNPKFAIDRALSEVPWLPAFVDRTFYAVGGSWRALAKIHMMETEYPLTNLHNYKISRDEVLSLTKNISRMSPEELSRYNGRVASRRLKVLPLSALILRRIVKLLMPSSVVISGFGIREGVLYDRMSKAVQAQDPLIQGCHEVAEMTGRFPEHGRRLLDWIDPLFREETAEDRRLRLAICMLSDVGWRGHPEYRAEKVLSEILYGRLIGIDHRGAGLIGLALYVCYGGSIGDQNTRIAEALVSSDDISYAKRVGLALRLAQRLSAGTARGLSAVKLQQEDGKLILFVKPGKRDLINEVVLRRLAKLADFLDLPYDVQPQA